MNRKCNLLDDFLLNVHFHEVGSSWHCESVNIWVPNRNLASCTFQDSRIAEACTYDIVCHDACGRQWTGRINENLDASCCFVSCIVWTNLPMLPESFALLFLPSCRSKGTWCVLANDEFKRQVDADTSSMRYVDYVVVVALLHYPSCIRLLMVLSLNADGTLCCAATPTGSTILAA